MNSVWSESLPAARPEPRPKGARATLDGPLALVALGLLSLALYAAVLPDQWLDFAMPQQRFLGLHALLELLAIVISLTLGLTAGYALGEPGQRRWRALPIAFLMVSVFDMLHVLTYAGMPDLISANSTNKAIVFWLLARLVAALALLAWAAAWEVESRHGRMLAGRQWLVAIVLLGAVAFGFQALWVPQSLPTLFVPGQGLTPLKQSLEGVLVILHLAALAALSRRMRRGDTRSGDTELRLALWLAVLGEGFFAIYSERVTDMANVIGHLYKVLTYLCLYRSIFIARVKSPFTLVTEAHEAAARRSQEYRDLLELAPDGVVVTDRAGRIVMVNQALEAMFGHRRDQLIGLSLETLLPERLREQHQLHRARYMAAPSGNAMRGRRGLRALHADGREFDVEVALGLDSGGSEPRLTAYITDVTIRRLQERELEHRATHDALTGLPNRWLFADRLRDAETSLQDMALVVMDLDGFQSFNEQEGTQAGDRLLREVSELLKRQLKPGATLARLGSDEFALLTPLKSGCRPDAQGDEALAQRWARELAQQLRSLGRGGGVSACLGLAVRTAHRGASDLLVQAQLALQAAKAQGSGRLMLYNEQLGERARRDARIATRLRLALQNNGLDLHYQPQVDIRTGEVHSFEALLRWSDAELGAVSPAQFVPVAEHAGLMPALGEMVLQLACQQLQCWRQAGFAARVAVNLSPLQFRDELLAERIVEELRQRNLPCESLCVEVTESAMMDDPAAAAAQLQRLADAGIEVHLDDFGTGHSSLAWLKDFPIRSIKIDRGFVRNMLADGNDDAIVRAVIGLAHTLGCKVIAEGVEEPEQLQRLNALGCDLYQGWLFSKALPAGEARKLASGRAN